MLLSPVNLTLITHISHTKLTFHLHFKFVPVNMLKARRRHCLLVRSFPQALVYFFVGFFYGVCPFQQVCFESGTVLNGIRVVAQ